MYGYYKFYEDNKNVNNLKIINKNSYYFLVFIVI